MKKRITLLRRVKRKSERQKSLAFRGKLAPHTGHSSQLLFETNDRNAQFLSAVVRSALGLADRTDLQLRFWCTSILTIADSCIRLLGGCVYMRANIVTEPNDATLVSLALGEM